MHQDLPVLLFGPVGHYTVQIVFPGLASGQCGEHPPVVLVPAFRGHEAAQRLPFLVGLAGDGDPPVLAQARVDAVGRCIRVPVTPASLLPAVDRLVQQVRRRKVQGGFQLGHVQVGALSGPPPVVQGGQNCGDSEPGADKVRVCAVGVDRVPVGPAGNVGKPRQGRKHRPKPGLALHGAAPAQHGSAEHDDPGIYFLEVLVAQPPALHGAGGKVFGDQIGPGRQAQHQFPGPWVAHVDGYPVFVGVVVGEIAAAIDAGDPACERRGPAQCLRALARLNPDYRGPVLRQVLGGHRAHGHPAEIQDLDAVQGFGGH